MKRFIDEHPLAVVMVVALLLRAAAVVFSKGYLFSDDYYETVRVAYDWLRTGILAPNGLLNWPGHTPGDIARFPLYTLFLHAIMRLYYAAGIESLATMMYGIRVAHALLSLIPVYAIFRTLELVTGSKRWGLIGGMAAAAHAAMPMLAVRCLIEVVGGSFWMLAIYLCYRAVANNSAVRDYVLAGIVSGLAAMIRFEILTAIAAVPFILWWQHKRLREAVLYSAGLGVMILVAGLVDWWLLGSFQASSVLHLKQGFSESPPYATSIFIYPAVLLVFFLPPLSVVLFVLAGCRQFWRSHPLFITIIPFVLIHSALAARQERYMLPIVGVATLMLVLVIWWQFQDRGYLYRHKRLFTILAGISVAINFILLVPLTFNYGHKGLVEPLVQVEQMAEHPSILLVTPEQRRIFPFEYGGLDVIERRYIRQWDDLQMFRESPALADEIEFYIVYPKNDGDLPRYLDSLTAYVGPLEEIAHITPSIVTGITHALNPKHNPSDEVWIYRRPAGESVD